MAIPLYGVVLSFLSFTTTKGSNYLSEYLTLTPAIMKSPSCNALCEIDKEVLCFAFYHGEVDKGAIVDQEFHKAAGLQDYGLFSPISRICGIKHCKVNSIKKSGFANIRIWAPLDIQSNKKEESNTAEVVKL